MTLDAAHAALERAWDARTDRTRAKHARQALAADPDAIDGYVLLAQSLGDDGERLAILLEGARRGRRLWAAEMKAPARHGFWLDIDTRPFMRVLHLLALELWNIGDHAGAIREAKTLLRLNRNDNQGIRELLAAWYPVTGDWAALEKLLARYPEDWTTSQRYTRWLCAFHAGGSTDAALDAALEVNPHVPGFLADPDAQPARDAEDRLAAMGYVTMGSPDEAKGYADFAREAWMAADGAIDRLTREVAARRPAS